MFLKICGIRRLEDADYLNEFIPDYAGFVFAQSRRQVTPEQAAVLRKRLRRDIKAAGVFVNAPLGELLHAVQTVDLDVVQLHGGEDAAYIHAARQALPPSVKLWKAVRVREAGDIRAAQELPADLLLLDAFSPAAYGGAGITADWDLIASHRPSKPFFLAGGLNTGNLCDAIKRVRPDGVDLSSGVETGGVKDREKIAGVCSLVSRSRL